MALEFNVKGHRNISCTHDSIIAFTTDNYLTKSGTDYAGVSADVSLQDLSKFSNLIKTSKVKVTIAANNVSDSFIAYGNAKLKLSDPTEMLIRTSDFIDEKTLFIKANKSAMQLNRELVNQLKKDDTKIKVNLDITEIKAVLFDLDDTLADSSGIHEFRQATINKIVSKNKINVEEFQKNLKEVVAQYVGTAGKPEHLAREKWYLETFEKMKLPANEKLAKEMSEALWKTTLSKVKLLPEAKHTLKHLKKQGIKLALVTNSDGELEIKERKIKKLGIQKMFDVIVTSDMVGENKPSPKIFLTAAEKLGVPVENCAMVGDNPDVDLVQARQLGMTTIWMMHGYWAGLSKDKKVECVDFSINEIDKVIDILRMLNGSPKK